MNNRQPSSQPLAQFRQQIAIVILMLFGVLSPSAQVQAQVQSSLPKQNYYQAFFDYRDGDFVRAGRDFERAYTTAYQQGQTRYLDSACCLTMIGECNYQLGNYSEALANYEQALNLYLRLNRQRWQRRVRLPQTLTDDNGAVARSKVRWAATQRNTRIARIPSTMLVSFGRIDAERAFVEGGVVDNATFRSVDVSEVMRCIGLALHRRRQLLGPLNQIMPLTKRLLSGLTVSGAGDGSLLGSYNGTLLGIALASSGRPKDAVKMLTRSLQIQGKYDHPLTPVGLTELTRIALANGKKSDAANLAVEASISAGVFAQYDLVDESLSLGTVNHLQTNKTPYPPLASAIQWCNRERFELPQFSLTQRLAECYAENGDAKTAREVIATAGSPSRIRDLSKTVSSARLKYVAALASFSEGNFGAGVAELLPAMNQYKNGSLWLFQLKLVSDLVANRSVSELEADKLYGVLLRDPNEKDWQLNPIEPLSFLVSNHVPAMEQWFEILIRRRQFDRALQVSELIRRHRFYSTLPMGGRLLAFRYSLHADKSMLTAETLAQRKRFLVNHVSFQELINGAKAIRDELKKLPLQPDANSDEARKQQQLLSQLARVSSIQEARMASFALGREPSDLAYPPSVDLPTFQQKMPEGTLCLSALKTGSGYHLFFVSRNRVRYANVISTRKLERAISQFLRDLGADGSATDTKTLLSESWKDSGDELKRGLFVGIPDESFRNLVELIVVPDGMLWYAPLAALPLKVDANGDFLVDFCPIRYAPTMSLAIRGAAGKAITNNTIAMGPMHSRAKVAATIAEVETLRKTLPDLNASQEQLAASGLSAWLSDHLMVWNESFIPENGFDYQPVAAEKSEHASLKSWMALPFQGPEYLSLPGMRAFGKGRKPNGSEMFVTTVALMSAGSRTVMLPRWPTGGSISLGLSRLYAEQLLKQPSASRSLRQAMIKARDLPFDIEKEPQLKASREPGDISAKHPFFWSSFLVVDQPRSAAGAAKANPLPAVNPPGAVPPGGAGPGSTSKTPAAPQPAASGSSTQGTVTPPSGSGTSGLGTSGSGTQTPTPPAPEPSPNVEKPSPESTAAANQ